MYFAKVQHLLCATESPYGQQRMIRDLQAVAVLHCHFFAEDNLFAYSCPFIITAYNYYGI